jgi:hypothetical protein
MHEIVDPGPLLGRTYALERGPRVCLRMARFRDRQGIAELLASHRLDPGELGLTRLVNFDPGRQLVIVATALVDATERIVGVGAIDLDSAGEMKPTIVLVDDELTGGLEPLVRRALTGQAAAIKRARAA